MANLHFTQQRYAGFRAAHDFDLITLEHALEIFTGSFYAPVRVIETEPILATYNSTDLELTFTLQEDLEIDGIDNLAVGDRVLVAGQTDLTQNGIYTVQVVGVDGTTATILERADDMNESEHLKDGKVVPVQEGDENENTRWRATIADTMPVLDTSNILFIKDITDVKRVVEDSFLMEGDDVEREWLFSHNWGIDTVTHEALLVSTGATVGIGFERVSNNQVKAYTTLPLETGVDIKVIIMGELDPTA